ncbi:pSer/pThr/pTyr-binding forkhead associated (FHA) protein [Kitasatospora sp. MAA4]|uniref:FHA domain-containing protein FhaB/FipA n=1 Tax=Kitasatospora sp. MAA4 TaxID=3035093 RepID=UPI002476C3E0|nr:FHA domain-containing protein [Kitasatospora sp. MAA4]MDH6134694.1 pSer/pThr/pTyr-binding forkhead associated (FHA) protein [Kitasatospora sp. MAA4]
MSELTLTVMRLGFLAVLWLFVIVAVQVIRSDMFGAKGTAKGGRRAAGSAAGAGAGTPPPRPQQAPPAQAQRDATQQLGRGRRGAPSQLVVVEGSLTGTTVALQGQTITLGRAHDSTIVLDDDYASSRHARIYPDQAGQWTVEDLGSTNGTYLDRQRLTTPTPLQPGMPIRIGRTVIELRK